jgi:LuxR family maltose regulon positive regulatory protein
MDEASVEAISCPGAPAGAPRSTTPPRTGPPGGKEGGVGSGAAPNGIPWRPSGRELRIPVIPRPRLDARLDRLDDVRMAAVVGAPGAGKTIAVAGWAWRRRMPVVHVAVDGSGDPRTRVWDAVETRLRRWSSREPSTAPGTPLVPGAGESADAFRRRLTGRIGTTVRARPTSGPVLLVLDDWRHPHPDLVDDALAVLEAVPDLRIALVGSAVHPLQQHSDVDRVELVGQELAFDRDELVVLLAAVRAAEPTDQDGPGPTGAQLRAQAEALETATAGWPIAVTATLLRSGAQELSADAWANDQLAHLGDAAIHRLAERTLLPVLTERGLRTFARRISVLEEITAEAAAAVAAVPDAAARLAELEDLGLLIATVSAGPTKWSLSTALRSVLRQDATHADPDGAREAHRAAGRWFRGAGAIRTALEHFAAAEDWREVTDLVVAGWPALSVAGLPRTRALLAQVPEDLIRDNVPYLGAVALLDRQPPVNEQSTHAIGQNLASDPGRDEPPLHRFIRMLSRLTSANVQHDSPRALRLIAEGDALIGSLPPLPAATNFVPNFFLSRGFALLGVGDRTEALQSNEAAWSVADQVGLTSVTVLADGYRAMITALDGDLPRAVRYADEAARTADERGWSATSHMIPTLLARALVALDRGDTQTAAALLDDRLTDARTRTMSLGPAGHLEPYRTLARSRLALLTAGGDRGIEVVLPPGPPMETPTESVLLAVARAEILTVRGELGRALAALAAAADVGLGHEVCAAPARARALLLQGDPAAASVAVRPCLDRPDHPAGSLLEALSVEAVAAWLQDRPREALAALRRAIALAGTTGARRPFTLVPHEPLLEAAAALSAGEAARLRSVLVSLPQLVRPRVDAELSRRERIILQHLATGRTLTSIAQSLHVSRNTVKSQTSAIYRKLGVSSRQAAVEQAVRLGLMNGPA